LRRYWYYAVAAVVIAIVLTLPIAIVGRSLDQQAVNSARQTMQIAADEAVLKEYVLRLTADEVVLHGITDTNRNSINNNSAQVGTNKLAISDLQALVAQAKAEVIKQLDGLAKVGPPTSVDTVAAKLLAILQRIDALEARIAALEAASSPHSPNPTPSAQPTSTPTPTPSPRPSPSPGERCIVQSVGFCSSASGGR
jgi:hypothetical protein